MYSGGLSDLKTNRFTTSGHMMTVQFISDSTVGAGGFTAEYTCGPAPAPPPLPAGPPVAANCMYRVHAALQYRPTQYMQHYKYASATYIYVDLMHAVWLIGHWAATGAASSDPTRQGAGVCFGQKL